MFDMAANGTLSGHKYICSQLKLKVSNFGLKFLVWNRKYHG